MLEEQGTRLLGMDLHAESVQRHLTDAIIRQTLVGYAVLLPSLVSRSFIHVNVREPFGTSTKTGTCSRHCYSSAEPVLIFVSGLA